MEALLFRLISIAFVLLTLTLASGMLFSESLFGQAFRVDHKTVFAFVSWLLFGGLLVGRRLGLARPAGAVLDPGRLRRADARLRGQPLRHRSRAASHLSPPAEVRVH
jgi:hypothetical protein